MNEEFIRASACEAIYERKVGTNTSYYRKSGSNILPNRASISKENEMARVARKGRNLLHPVVGQFLAHYTRIEESPLKQNKPFNVRTQIWLDDDFPQFIGYGTTGISGEDGHIIDTGDLLVFCSNDVEWNSIRVFFFVGMGKNPEAKEAAMKYVAKMIVE